MTTPMITARTAAKRATEAEQEAARLAAAAEAASTERESARQAAQEAAKAETRWKRQGRTEAVRWVEELESRFASAGAGMLNERPGIDTRIAARQFLHPAGDTGAGLLDVVCAVDLDAANFGGLQREAGLVMARLTEAGIDGDDELFLRADDIECAAWGALISRVKVLAGESP